MPLHVAAQSGQALQIELLLIYGADPAGYDTNGKTPVEFATYVLISVMCELMPVLLIRRVRI